MLLHLLLTPAFRERRFENMRFSLRGHALFFGNIHQINVNSTATTTVALRIVYYFQIFIKDPKQERLAREVVYGWDIGIGSKESVFFFSFFLLLSINHNTHVNKYIGNGFQFFAFPTLKASMGIFYKKKNLCKQHPLNISICSQYIHTATLLVISAIRKWLKLSISTTQNKWTWRFSLELGGHEGQAWLLLSVSNSMELKILSKTLP